MGHENEKQNMYFFCYLSEELRPSNLLSMTKDTLVTSKLNAGMSLKLETKMMGIGGGGTGGRRGGERP